MGDASFQLSDYQSLRKQWSGPVPFTRAKDAYALIKVEQGDPALRDFATELTISLPGGWRIEVEVQNDDHYGLDDALGSDCFEQDHCNYCQNDDIPDGWVDRKGRVRVMADRVKGWFAFEEGYPYADRLHTARKSGLSRHDAWLATQQWTQKQANFCRDVLNGEIWFYGVIVKLIDAEGCEVEDESCWGFESSYRLSENYFAVDTVRTLRGIHRRAIEDELQGHRSDAAVESERAKALTARLRSVYDELRVMPVIGSALCLELRHAIQRLRKERRDAKASAKPARVAAHRTKQLLAEIDQQAGA